MIIIQIAGGLGNQLQQYALYQKFKSLGAEAKLDLSWFEQFEDTGRESKLYEGRENRTNRLAGACRETSQKTASADGTLV